ncbi:MAG: DUF1707 and DUF2154 domain-containing protein, partial [Pseudomonadota bacterium]
MTIPLDDRPLETVKQEAIDILVHNYSHGYISSDAFERRLDVVVAAEKPSEMMAQVEDLEQSTDETISQAYEKEFAVNYSDQPAEEVDWMINIMGGSDRNGVWNVAKKLYVFSFMGGAEIDFTDARFAGSTVTIYSFTFWAGNDIYVPENVNVICKTFNLMGGTDNRAPSSGGLNAPTIIVKGINIMGGMDIKVKRTIREKYIALANKMKSLLADK